MLFSLRQARVMCTNIQYGEKTETNCSFRRQIYTHAWNVHVGISPYGAQYMYVVMLNVELMETESWHKVIHITCPKLMSVYIVLGSCCDVRLTVRVVVSVHPWRGWDVVRYNGCLAMGQLGVIFYTSWNVLRESETSVLKE